MVGTACFSSTTIPKRSFLNLSDSAIESRISISLSQILDSIAESERLRNERLGIVVEETKDVPTKKIKNKKKKRFFFF